ncbi:MAG: hypothetical protein QOF51_236, partial [Chloroflexota bacterium]|nr:hypothetical protein [Chloroflexota bacterium]
VVNLRSRSFGTAGIAHLPIDTDPSQDRTRRVLWQVNCGVTH